MTYTCTLCGTTYDSSLLFCPACGKPCDLQTTSVPEEPVVIQQEPVVIQPEPVAIQPEPVAIQPEPVVIQPEPVAPPSPVYEDKTFISTKETVQTAPKKEKVILPIIIVIIICIVLLCGLSSLGVFLYHTLFSNQDYPASSYTNTQNTYNINHNNLDFHEFYYPDYE